MSAYKITEYNKEIYLSDYNAPFDTNEDFLEALQANDFKKYEFFTKCKKYSSIIDSQKNQILRDMNNIGLTETKIVNSKETEVWSFYLTRDELNYIGFDNFLINSFLIYRCLI